MTKTAVTLHSGDNVLSMRTLPENSVHSIVTDPPYMLTSIVKRFGKEGSAAARAEGNDGSFARLSGGFMNKKWDSPQIELPPLSAEFGHYMAGLIDGEGCFHVHKKQVNGCETYDCQFSITLRADDRDILVEMQRQLGGIGSLADRPRAAANPQARYCISSKADCQVLRAALSVFPLRAKKARDFEIWAHALDAWVNHEPKSSWDDVSFYRDQLMLVKRFGSFYKPELLFHYRWLKESYRVLLPGGYVFAFSGSRTGHWQACAMELAGFIMHPMHGWCFGSGFPKAHAADKAIDKALGKKDSGREHQPGSYMPTTPEAAEWEGWAYGTQAQKPALEPIYFGQKPFSEKTGAANLIKHGVGAVNIDDCRVPFANADDEAESKLKNQHGDFDSGAMTNQVYGKFTKDRGNYNAPGRHPSNLILDGSPVVVAMFPVRLGAGDQRGKQNGTRPGGFGDIGAETGDGVPCGQTYSDSGSAARFFHQFPRYACETCQDTGTLGYEYVDHMAVGPSTCAVCEGQSAFTPGADPLFYQAKAGKLDRDGSKHPTVKPIALMQYLMRHITPPGGTVLDPFAGSGTTAEAARREGFDCILMEAEPDYLDFLRRRFDLPSPVDDILADLFNENKRGINSLQDELDQGRSSTSGGQNREVQKSPTDFPDLMIEDCSSDDHGLAHALASNSSKKAFVPSRSAAGADLADLLF